MNSCTVTLLLALFKIIIAVILQIEYQDSAISDTLECDSVARKNYTSPAWTLVNSCSVCGTQPCLKLLKFTTFAHKKYSFKCCHGWEPVEQIQKVNCADIIHDPTLEFMLQYILTYEAFTHVLFWMAKQRLSSYPDVWSFNSAMDESHRARWSLLVECTGDASVFRALSFPGSLPIWTQRLLVRCGNIGEVLFPLRKNLVKM